MSNIIEDANDKISSFDEVLDRFYSENDLDFSSMLSETSINDAVSRFESSVFSFNATAGNFDNLDTVEGVSKALSSQVALILEEVKETIEAKNPIEALDGIVDVLVTAFGYAQMLEHIGVDVAKAMNLIAENNLSKFPLFAEDARRSVEMYTSKGINVTAIKNDGRWVIKDEKGKVRKPYNYKPVNLSSCVEHTLTI